MEGIVRYAPSIQYGRWNLSPIEGFNKATSLYVAQPVKAISFCKYSNTVVNSIYSNLPVVSTVATTDPPNSGDAA